MSLINASKILEKYQWLLCNWSSSPATGAEKCHVYMIAGVDKNNLGVGNVSMPTKIRFRLLNSILTCYFVFGYNISYYNTLKLQKELFLFVLLSFSITLMNLHAQIRGAQTRYTIVSFDLNQPLDSYDKIKTRK